MTLADHFACLEAAIVAARAAPLSIRKAMLAVMLADAYADHLFAADPHADDILAFRAGLAASAPALGTVFAVAALRPDGPRLVTETVEIPLADYAALPIEDFMVSLYNAHTVQRVRIACADGARMPVHEVLDGALEALRPFPRHGAPESTSNLGPGT